ncbi:hypothetical protein ACP70R_016106 [Stipagrostis hirtigluma subsp. patula]
MEARHPAVAVASSGGRCVAGNCDGGTLTVRGGELFGASFEHAQVEGAARGEPNGGGSGHSPAVRQRRTTKDGADRRPGALRYVRLEHLAGNGKEPGRDSAPKPALVVLPEHAAGRLPGRRSGRRGAHEHRGAGTRSWATRSARAPPLQEGRRGEPRAATTASAGL